MKKILNVLFFIFCLTVVFCYSYDENIGNIIPGEIVLSGGTYTIENTTGGGILGQSQKNTLAMDTFLMAEIEALEDADVRMTAREIEINYPDNLENTPTDNSYVHPGAQLTFSLSLVNFKNVWAVNYTIRDVIPANTHLYYTGKPPTLNGDVFNISYQGVTSNAEAGNLVDFLFDLAPNGSATFSYTVTVD